MAQEELEELKELEELEEEEGTAAAAVGRRAGGSTRLFLRGCVDIFSSSLDLEVCTYESYACEHESKTCCDTTMENFGCWNLRALVQRVGG